MQPDIPKIQITSIEWALLNATNEAINDIQRMRQSTDQADRGKIADRLDHDVQQVRDFLRVITQEVGEIREKQRTSFSTDIAVQTGLEQ